MKGVVTSKGILKVHKSDKVIQLIAFQLKYSSPDPFLLGVKLAKLDLKY